MEDSTRRSSTLPRQSVVSIALAQRMRLLSNLSLSLTNLEPTKDWSLFFIHSLLFFCCSFHSLRSFIQRVSILSWSLSPSMDLYSNSVACFNQSRNVISSLSSKERDSMINCDSLCTSEETDSQCAMGAIEKEVEKRGKEGMKEVIWGFSTPLITRYQKCLVVLWMETFGDH